MQNGLDFLNEKYNVGKKALLKDNRTISVEGKDYPLLPWRQERRFIEMKNLVASGEINGISVMRTLRIVKKDSDLYDEVYREFDICQYALNSRISEIFAIGDEKYAINIIAKTVDGYVCTFEISATLGKDAPIIDKHEINALSGVVCDRAVDTQITQNSIYLYGESEHPQTFTDVDAELFGLSVDECAIVRNALEVTRSTLDYTPDTKELKKLVSAVKASMTSVENVKLGEM